MNCSSGHFRRRLWQVSSCQTRDYLAGELSVNERATCASLSIRPRVPPIGSVYKIGLRNECGGSYWASPPLGLVSNCTSGCVGGDRIHLSLSFSVSYSLHETPGMAWMTVLD
jgi:hypothetical protein